MDFKNYRDLKVWQLGIEIAEKIYQMSDCFPKHELYGLGSQVQRAAVSIPANIAEGHERGSTKDFLRHLSIAHGSRAELETHLILADRLGYCNRDQLAVVFEMLDELGRMMRGLQKSLRAKL